MSTVRTPLCPRCGGLLEIATFVETWDSNGEPKQIETDFACRHCKVRWIDMDLAAEEELLPEVAQP
jgi:hypothetical protein